MYYGRVLFKNKKVIERCIPNEGFYMSIKTSHEIVFALYKLGVLFLSSVLKVFYGFVLGLTSRQRYM